MDTLQAEMIPSRGSYTNRRPFRETKTTFGSVKKMVSYWAVTVSQGPDIDEHFSISENKNQGLRLACNWD